MSVWSEVIKMKDKACREDKEFMYAQEKKAGV